MNQDRRGSARKPVLVKTTLKFNGTSQEAVATDWSEHGAFVQTNEAPPVGTPVSLVVNRPGKQPLTIQSAVARQERHPMRGIGLSWVENALPLLREAFERPAANTENPIEQSGGFDAKSALPLSDTRASAWEASLESATTSFSEGDPFASFAEEESLFRAVDQAERVEEKARQRTAGDSERKEQPVDWSQLGAVKPPSNSAVDWSQLPLASGVSGGKG